MLILAVEWLDIDPVEIIREGLRLKPKQVDHAPEVAQRLEAVGVPYTRAGASVRITGHVRNGGTT